MQSRKRVGEAQKRNARNRRGSMSFVRVENGVMLEVLAIFLADIHLSLKAPLWRSAEPDWLGAQVRTLEEVRELHELHKCPVICAGDIFDRNKKIALH